MKVYIIGAGPGDPELITVRGARLVESCPVVLYTGSLGPSQVAARARPGSRVLDSSGMTLDQIAALSPPARDAREAVPPVHTGDPPIFHSVGERTRRFHVLL